MEIFNRLFMKNLKHPKSALFIFILVQSLGCFLGEKNTPPTFYQEIDKYKHFQPGNKTFKKTIKRALFLSKKGDIFTNILMKTLIFILLK
ncbi:MAG: hypothetical protein R2769_03790 [Saprospiraceae bacterium]